MTEAAELLACLSTFSGYIGAFCLGMISGMTLFAFAAVTEEQKRIARYLPQEGEE